MSALPEQYLSLQDYFQLEETSEMKHEYYQGTIYDMAGANLRHNLIVTNLISSLHTQLRGSACNVFPSDLRIKVEAIGLYTYPDLSILCGDVQYADGREDCVSNPALLIEVLSPNTERYDRGKKFQYYRTIETLHDYLLIAQDNAHVEHYVRQDAQRWMLMEYSGDDQSIPLDAIGCTLTLASIYENVVFDA